MVVIAAVDPTTKTMTAPFSILLSLTIFDTSSVISIMSFSDSDLSEYSLLSLSYFALIFSLLL